MQKVYRCLRSNFQIVNFNGNSFFNRLLGNGRSNLHDANVGPPGNFNFGTGFDKMTVQDLCPCVCARMYSPFCPSFAYLIICLIDNFFRVIGYSWNLQECFSTTRGTFEPKTPARSHLKKTKKIAISRPGVAKKWSSDLTPILSTGGINL